MRVMWLVLVLAGCDPMVSIGDPDAGADAGVLIDAGMGGDPVCNRWSSAAFFAGQSSCVGTRYTITADADAQNTCLAAIPDCTTSDRALLDSYLNCIAQAPPCTSGNENAAAEAFASCANTAFNALLYSCRRKLVQPRASGKRVFITQQGFPGNLGGLAGADLKCSDAATAAGLNGTWQAWLSTTTVHAKDRLADVGPWVDLWGRPMVASKTTLIDDGPSTPGIWIDERGVFLSSGGVWTATNWEGVYRQTLTVGPPCAEWTSSERGIQARIGSIGSTGNSWTWYAARSCEFATHLICFEQ